MISRSVPTSLGNLRVDIKPRQSSAAFPADPIVFLHGLFLDRNLWTDLDLEPGGRPHVYVDMPGHGASSDVGKPWELEDGVHALKELMDHLNVARCIAIGHSWGAMTALRAAVQSPERFSALGLFNMPSRRVAGLSRLGFRAHQFLVNSRAFYARQAAKSMYSPEFLADNRAVQDAMVRRLSQRPSRELWRAVSAVLLNANDATGLLASLSVPTLAIVGSSDYVGKPPHLRSNIVDGGHVSPHESPQETIAAIQQVVSMSRNDT